VARIGREAAEIPAALPDARVGRAAMPRRTGIVGTVQAARIAVDERVHAARRSRRHGEPDASDARREARARDARPGVAAVGGFVYAAAGAVRRWIHVPGRPPGLPQRGEQRACIVGREDDVDRARVRIRPEDLLPVRAAVARAEYAALRVGSVRMAERGDVDEVRVARIDEDLADLLRVGESDMAPAAA